MKTVLIYSGKGGVGKTTTTVNLAKSLNEKGHSVCILDMDVNGPSLPTLYPQPNVSDLLTIFSFGYEYEAELYIKDAIVRKYIRKAVKEIKAVNPEFVLIDTPPSITDVHHSILKLLKISGVIIVSQPNAMSISDVKRTASFFLNESVPLIGVVENMVQGQAPNKYHFGDVITQIPLSSKLDTVITYNEYKDLYSSVAEIVLSFDLKKGLSNAKKRILFNEEITAKDLGFHDFHLEDYSYYAKTIEARKPRFHNCKSWPLIHEILKEKDYLGSSFMGAPTDKILEWQTPDRIKAIVEAFKEEEEPYFLVTKSPCTGIKVFPGEVGKGTLLVDDKFWGVPRVSFKTEEGELVLFSHECKPATMEDIKNITPNGGFVSTVGRYMPSIAQLCQISNQFGSLIGLPSTNSAKWIEAYIELCPNEEYKERVVEFLKMKGWWKEVEEAQAEAVLKKENDKEHKRKRELLAFNRSWNQAEVLKTAKRRAILDAKKEGINHVYFFHMYRFFSGSVKEWAGFVNEQILSPQTRIDLTRFKELSTTPKGIFLCENKRSAYSDKKVIFNHLESLDYFRVYQDGYLKPLT